MGLSCLGQGKTHMRSSEPSKGVGRVILLAPPGASAAAPACAGYLRRAVLVCNDGLVHHTFKDSVVDHTDRLLDGCCGCSDVGDGRCEFQIHDVVSIVGDRGLVAVGLVVGAVSCAQDRFAPLELRQGRYDTHRVFMAKWRDFDGKREGWAEALAEFALVHDADELF